MNAMPTDFDNLWEYLFKGDFDEYYKIYDRVMTEKFKNDLNETKYPLRIFFKGINYRTSRAIDKTFTLVQAIKQIFPNAIENDQFKEKFQTVDVSVSGIKQSGSVTIEYLYDLFCNPDGYLYIVVNV
jgi:hypothetical protein